mmetsp:Transcript_2890/g.5824  ORF Transcript_2890/g.5824 Transcript_2890/m.5824 type:complete len:186 (-) Transcript_2890:173-730(-)
MTTPAAPIGIFCATTRALNQLGDKTVRTSDVDTLLQALCTGVCDELYPDGNADDEFPRDGASTSRWKLMVNDIWKGCLCPAFKIPEDTGTGRCHRYYISTRHEPDFRDTLKKIITVFLSELGYLDANIANRIFRRYTRSPSFTSRPKVAGKCLNELYDLTRIKSKRFISSTLIGAHAPRSLWQYT